MMKNYLKRITLFMIFGISTNLIAASESSNIAVTPFSPYVDMTLNVHWDPTLQDLVPVDLVQISQQSGIKNYSLAFITDAGSCFPAWGAHSAYPVSSGWGKSLTDQLRQNNISYIISLGGAANDDLSMACSDAQLTEAYEKIINIYKPKGLDFDIENGTADVEKVIRVLQTIQRAHPELKISFTLPIMPEGLVYAGKNLVNLAKEAQLNFSVNIMTMDYGPSYQGDMGQYAIQAATNLFNFLKELYSGKSDAALWKMIEITPMIGVNDVSVEQFTLANADSLRVFASQKHIGQLSMWSITRDAPCADTRASSYCSGNSLQTKIYEFSLHFMQMR